MRTLAATMLTITTITFALFAHALATQSAPAGPALHTVSR
jgi:uncharacterized membrane protein